MNGKIDYIKGIDGDKRHKDRLAEWIAKVRDENASSDTNWITLKFFLDRQAKES